MSNPWHIADSRLAQFFALEDNQLVDDLCKESVGGVFEVGRSVTIARRKNLVNSLCQTGFTSDPMKICVGEVPVKEASYFDV